MQQTQIQTQFNNKMSLYIPHVFPNFTTEFITNVFETLDFGSVDHVDLVAKQDKYGKLCNAAYIHFKEWNQSSMTEMFQAKVTDPNKQARVMYDDPWYWLVLENNAKKRNGSRKECLNLDETDKLISELYNQPMDISCEFDECVDEIIHLKAFNMETQLKLAEKDEEIDRLHQEIVEKQMDLEEERSRQDEIIERITEIVTKCKSLDEVRDDLCMLFLTEITRCSS